MVGPGRVVGGVLGVHAYQTLFTNTLLAKLIANYSGTSLNTLSGTTCVGRTRGTSDAAIGIRSSNNGASLAIHLNNGNSARATFHFRVGPSILRHCGTLGKASCMRLPRAYFRLPTSPIVIPTNRIATTPTRVSVLPFSRRVSSSNSICTLPIALHYMDNNVGVLNSTSSFLVIYRQGGVVPIPVFGDRCQAKNSDGLGHIVLGVGSTPVAFGTCAVRFGVCGRRFATHGCVVINFSGNRKGVGGHV